MSTRLTTVAIFILVLTLPAFAAADRPNVIIISADDLGWNDVGYHGSEIRTPNIDKLASEGVMLERFYAYPMCSPTRAALMTGRSAIELGVNNPIAPTAKGGLPLEERLLPEAFRDAGYQTFMVGKWHLGMAHVNYFPQNRGFDHFYGHLGAAIDFYTHRLRGGLDWQRNGTSVREEGYSTELLTSEAVRLLRRRDKDRPVLLYLSYNAVHIPLQAPQAYIDKYSDIEDEERRVYAAMTEAMDAGIGEVLKTLDSEGMRASTLVLFISDNGGGVGASSAPLRLGKGTVFEGGIRVPAAIRWPGGLEGGRASDQFIAAHDWLPTLAAAAGIPVGNEKPLYGDNLWPAIRDGETIPRKDVLIGARGSFALFHEDWKLVQAALRGGDRKTFLFRISEDPNEKNDLAAEHPEIVRELSAKIEAFPKGASVSGSPPGQRGPGAPQRPGGRPGQPGQRAQRGQGGRPLRQGDPGLRVDRGGHPGSGPETREPYAEAAARN